MSAADSLENITTLFTQMHHCADQLNECLLEERSHLKDNNSEGLISSSQTKEVLMQQLGSLEAQRKESFSDRNINCKADYLLWLDTLDPSKELRNQWLEISKKIINCQKTNASNGIITEKMSLASQEILNVLSGNNLPANNTYTASGKKPDSAASLHNTTA